MSTMNYDEQKNGIIPFQKLGFLCETHQVLKKYYLVKEKRFICEYDGIDGFTDTILHLNQVIDLNYQKIPYLLSQTSSPQYNARIKDLLPAIKEILSRVSKESSDILSVSDKYTSELTKRILHGFQNSEKEYAKQVLSEIPLNSNGKPDITKLARSVETEKSLVALAHLLVEFDQNSYLLSTNDFTDSLTNNIETIQVEAIDLLKNLIDLVDLSYDGLIEEVGKCEGKLPDRKYRYLLKSNFIHRKEHEEIVKTIQKEKGLKEVELANLYENSLKPLKEENGILRKTIDDLRSKNYTLEANNAEKDAQVNKLKNQNNTILNDERQRNLELISALNNEKSNIRRFELENIDLRKKLNELNMVIQEKESDLVVLREALKNENANKSDILKKRIAELEKILIQINKQNEELSQLNYLPQELQNQKDNYEKLIAKMENNHLLEIRKVNSQKDQVIDDLTNEISELKNSNNTINSLVSSTRDDSLRKLSENENLLNYITIENNELKKKIEELNSFINTHNINFNNQKDQLTKRIRELELEILSQKNFKDTEAANLLEANKHLSNKLIREKEAMQAEINDLQLIITNYKNDKTKDTYLNKIIDLEKENIRLNKELEASNIIMKGESAQYTKLHSDEIKRLNDHYARIIEDLNNSVNDEKALNKRIAAERDLANNNYKDSLLQMKKLRDESNFIKANYDTKINLLMKDISDLNFSKEKHAEELRDERERNESISSDNIKLRQIKNDADILILELREKLEIYKVEDEKVNVLIRNQDNELANMRRAHEKTISDKDNYLKENQSRNEKIISGLEKRISELSAEHENSNKLKANYLDRISELEREIFQLRNLLKSRETDLEQQTYQNNNLKTIIEKLKESNYQNLTMQKKDNSKLTEAGQSNVDFVAVKETLQKRMINLEKELENERDNLQNYTLAYENKLNENNILITQVSVEKENLTNQLDFLKSEFEKEKNKNTQKINDLNELLRENTLKREQYKQDLEGEKNKLNLYIMNLEKENKDMRDKINDSRSDNTEDSKRVRELEEILLEDRNRISILSDENERLKKSLNEEMDDIIKTSELNKRRILELETALNDEKNRNNHISFELDILKTQLVEKEKVLESVMEDSKITKLHDDKLLKEISNENKDLRRKVSLLEGQLEDHTLLTSAGNPNSNQLNSQYENKISELNRLNMQNSNLLETLQEELNKLRKKEKTSDEEILKLNNTINDLKHENEILRVNSHEQNNYDQFYNNLKSEYEKVLEEREILNNKLQDVEQEFNKEKAKNSNLNNNANQKISDLHAQIEELNYALNKYEVEIESKNTQISQMEVEIELLKSKLDSQFNEINVLKDKQSSSSLNSDANILHQLDEARKYKERIESELNDKKRRLTECQYENDQLKNQNKEQKIIIDNLKRKLGLENDLNINDLRSSVEFRKSKGPNVPNPFYEEMTKSPYYKINFEEEIQPQFPLKLLLNNENWKMLKPWVIEVQGENLNKNYKLNLLYKASRDGFSHKRFKERCRRITPTIIVLQTSFDKIIGGYTPLRWDSPKNDNYEYVSDSQLKTFLFSFSIGRRFKIKPDHKDFAICNSSLMGPIFGAGSDLEILSDCDKVFNNYSGIGKSFDFKGDPVHFYGGLKYLVKDYEVYELVFEEKI